jgi:DNA-binding MarR family transcriptional regulator
MRTPALLRVLLRQTLRTTDHRLAAGGFSDLHPMQVGVLHLIGTGRRVTDLAAATGATKQALTQTVGVLVERGYVERHPDPSDGRAKVVTLTQRGREATVASLEIAEHIDRSWEAVLGAEGLASLRSRLTALVGDARRADGGWTSI